MYMSMSAKHLRKKYATFVDHTAALHQFFAVALKPSPSGDKKTIGKDGEKKKRRGKGGGAARVMWKQNVEIRPQG